MHIVHVVHIVQCTIWCVVDAVVMVPFLIMMEHMIMMTMVMIMTEILLTIDNINDHGIDFNHSACAH